MLTQKDVERIKPPKDKDRIEEPDGLVPGLAFVTFKSGKKSWCIRYRDADGRLVKLTLGRFPVLGLQEAREKAREALLAVGRGVDPHKDKMAAKRLRIEADSDLFPKVFDRFLAAPGKKGKRRERTITEWRRLIEKDVLFDEHKQPRWKEKRIQDITRRNVRDVLEAVEARGGGITANRVYSALLALFNFAVAKDIV